MHPLPSAPAITSGLDQSRRTHVMKLAAPCVGIRVKHSLGQVGAHKKVCRAGLHSQLLQASLDGASFTHFLVISILRNSQVLMSRYAIRQKLYVVKEFRTVGGLN